MTTSQSPGPADAVFRPSDGPGIDPIAALPVPELLDEADLIAAGGLLGIGEPHEHSTTPLPRLGEVIRDVERLLAQASTILRRPVDPASEPTVVAWPAISDDIMVHRLLLDEVAVNLYWALRKLGKVAALPMPPAGSAVQVPARQDPASAGPVAAPDGPSSSGPPPAGAPPVAPGRGIGPGYLGPASMDQAAFARHVRDDAVRRRP